MGWCDERHHPQRCRRPCMSWCNLLHCCCDCEHHKCRCDVLHHWRKRCGHRRAGASTQQAPAQYTRPLALAARPTGEASSKYSTAGAGETDTSGAGSMYLTTGTGTTDAPGAGSMYSTTSADATDTSVAGSMNSYGSAIASSARGSCNFGPLTDLAISVFREMSINTVLTQILTSRRCGL